HAMLHSGERVSPAAGEIAIKQSLFLKLKEGGYSLPERRIAEIHVMLCADLSEVGYLRLIDSYLHVR
ncbi:MAG: hypothetical protein R6U13_00875, partial [Desulfatiglandaceae bacterium]